MPPLSVLALFAHPDDETLGCGATLAALAAAGNQVQVVFVGDGIITARPTIDDNRADGAAACAVLGLSEPIFLGYPDQLLDTVARSELINAVATIGLRPDLVLSHSASDLNGDHVMVSHVARVVSRPIGRPIALLECEIPGNSAWNGAPFAANWFTDVRDHLDRKLEALACYRNEARDFPHPCSPEAVRALAEAHGGVSGLGQAEAFRVVRGYAALLP